MKITQFNKAFGLIVIVLVISISNVQVFGDSGWATCDITFIGEASGGELILCNTLNRNTTFVSVITTPHETAESVVKRLADKINTSNPFSWLGFSLDTPVVTASGATLKGLPSFRTNYAIAGTEAGLGIPPSIHSLSCSYNKKVGEISLQWVNPPGGYDDIAIILNWDRYNHRSVFFTTGTSQKHIITLDEYPVNIYDLDIWVMGYRNGIPSGLAAIHLTNNAQEEIFGIPFINGVAPNWQVWSQGVVLQREQITSRIEANLVGTRNVKFNPVRTAKSKPFKQILKTPTTGGTLGIWRKFLGLSPGHTYKVTARLNTLQMDPNNPNWSFSLHAIPDDVSGKNLTTQQLGGSALLPDGSRTMDAGEIIRYAEKITTEGKFIETSAKITLPGSITSLTVWLRFMNEGFGEVAFDWIKLEDITPAH